MPSYTFCSPPIAVGANKLLVDLFNATGSGTTVDIRGVYLIPKLDVAVTGVVSVRGDIYRTSAVGTGGTAAVRDNAASVNPDPAGGSIAKLNESSADLPAQITFRTAPTGGATISRWVRPWHYFPEETGPSSYLTPGINWIARCGGDDDRSFIVHEGSGLLVKQNAVASVGSVSVLITFRI